VDDFGAATDGEAEQGGQQGQAAEAEGDQRGDVGDLGDLPPAERVQQDGPQGLVFFRRQCLTWGARPDEVSGKLPGEELLPGAGTVATRVSVLDPERTLTLRFADGNWVWIFALFAEDGRTRLISRNRIAGAGAWPARLFGTVVMEPGSLIMERKMLLGIRERAEDLARAQAA
jgi:hypothetical protein